MSKIDRRELLNAGCAFVPFAALSLLGGNPQPGYSNSEIELLTDDDDKKSPKKENEGKKMEVQYLEIVTPDAEAMCKLYSTIHDVKFSEPVAALGNARTAKLDGGALLSIRKPMHGQEKPVTRQYMKVKDLDKAVAAAKEAGAEIAIASMDIPNYGKIAIFIQGGIECGLWQT